MRDGSSAVTKTVGGGVSLLTVIQIVFIILKLCHVIDWQWVFVLMPLVVEGGLVFLIAIIVVTVCLIGAAIGRRDRKMEENGSHGEND